MSDDHDRWWQVADAARVWRVSPQRVRQLCGSGRVPGARRDGDIQRGPWLLPAQSPQPLGRTLGRPRAAAPPGPTGAVGDELA